MRIIDISRRIEPGIAVWPGDTPYAFELATRIAEGAAVNVGRVEMSVHTGTHADAPLHFADGAEDAAGLPLEPYLGPCVVADVLPGKRGIGPGDLPAGLGARVRAAGRLLLRTYDRRPVGFDERLRHATVDLVEWLAARGAVLLGLDSDSMDAFDSKDLPAHHALLSRGISILEGLDLASVAPGVYELVALPLPLAGADASPVRAVLIER